MILETQNWSPFNKYPISPDNVPLKWNEVLRSLNEHPIDNNSGWGSNNESHSLLACKVKYHFSKDQHGSQIYIGRVYTWMNISLKSKNIERNAKVVWIDFLDNGTDALETYV